MVSFFGRNDSSSHFRNSVFLIRNFGWNVFMTGSKCVEKCLEQVA